MTPASLRAAIREAVRVAPADRRVTVDVAADGSVQIVIEPLGVESKPKPTGQPPWWLGHPMPLPETPEPLRLDCGSVRRMPRIPLDDETKAAVLDRDSYRCRYCGRPIGDYGALAIDHVRPLRWGGTNDFDNLVAACKSCNSSKLDRILGEEWQPHVENGK